jgi:hypothetical protein
MHLEKFGGHAMAAGLTMREDRFAAFREAFLCAAREMLTDEWLLPRLRLDGELAPGDVTLQLLDELDSLEPFGIGNHAPVFFARGVTLASEPRVMKEKHYSLILRHGRSESRAVWFGGATEKLPACRGTWHLPSSAMSIKVSSGRRCKSKRCGRRRSGRRVSGNPKVAIFLKTHALVAMGFRVVNQRGFKFVLLDPG